MKKFRKIMAVLVAAMMIVAMTVPAWATTTSGVGRLDGAGGALSYGTITIANAEDGETYNIYRIFDLYSFTDNDVATSQHSDSERYSYMIASDSPWYSFIANYYGKGGTPATANGTEYFIIDTTNPITFTNTAANPSATSKTYYFVEGNPGAFNNVGGGAEIDEDDHDTVYNVFTSLGTAKVQEFAQNALLWAQDKAPYTSDSSGVTPVVTIINARSTSPAMTTTRNDSITSANASVDAVTGALTVPKMSLGYYLIDSKIGSLVSLDTTNPNATIAEKNEVPSITKKVKARKYATAARHASNHTYNESYSNSIWVNNTDYEIGTPITFKIEVTVPYGAKGYKLHDVLESGFNLKPTTSTANDNFKVYLRDSNGTSDHVSASNDTYAIVTSTDDGCDFEIDFKDKWLAGMEDDTVIEIEYLAVLNTNAVIYGENESSRTQGDVTVVTAAGVIEGGDDNPQGIAQIPRNYNTDGKNTNSAILTFGEHSGRGEGNASTRWAVATVDTFRTDVAKTEEASSSNVYPLLAGAQFKLYREKTKEENEQTVSDLNASNKQQAGALVPIVAKGNGVYRVQAEGETPVDNSTTFIESDGTNAIRFEGLQAGTYFLEETKAPTGYNKIDGYYRFTVTGDDASNNTAAVSITANTNTNHIGQVTYTFVNKNGTEVSSSGMGLTTAASNAFPAAIISGDTTKVYNSVDTNQGGIQIINNSSTELPSTGGMGTTVLYIVGGMLVILAGAYLFFSRKRTA